MTADSAALPLVTCIMPTCHRRGFVPRAIEYFLRQDYPSRELLILDDGSDPVADLVPADPRIRYTRLERRASLGAKRNLACGQARGDLILHWDDDDWYAPNRIQAQVSALLAADGEVCGLRQMLFYAPDTAQVWLYDYPEGQRRWLTGGSLLYWKRVWQRHPFANVQVGEDTRFLWSMPLDRAVTLADYRIYVALVHARNTSPKETGGQYWHPWQGDLRDVMGADLDGYQSQPPQEIAVEHHPAEQPTAAPPLPAVTERTAPGPRLHAGNHTADAPRVSCILATGNRPGFARQAIRCFLRQTMADSELIVVDDGSEPVEALCAGLLRVRYLRLERPTLLGTKLNLGIRQARGQIIQKLDDDDYYAPGFLERAVRALPAGANAIAAWDCFLVLLAGSPRLHFSGHGWAAGGSLCFPRSLWERAPFRDLPKEVDAWFLRDQHAPITRVCAPELYLVVRHGKNTWTETNRVPVDAYFQQRPVDARRIENIVEPLDWDFYHTLAGQA